MIKSILVLLALFAFFASTTEAIYGPRCKQYPDGRVTCVGPLSPDVLSDSEFSHCSMVGKRMICSGPALPPSHYRKRAPTAAAAAAVLSDSEWSHCGKVGNRVLCTGPALPPSDYLKRKVRNSALSEWSIFAPPTTGCDFWCNPQINPQVYDVKKMKEKCDRLCGDWKKKQAGFHFW